MLVRSGDRWEATADLAHVPIPAGVSALLAARLDRLDVEERAVLERASVVGQVFDRQAVVALSPEPARPAVGRTWPCWSARQLIRAEGAGGAADGDGHGRTRGFRFRHLLIRDVTYEALPKRRRAELHERLADWLGREDEGCCPSTTRSPATTSSRPTDISSSSDGSAPGGGAGRAGRQTRERRAAGHEPRRPARGREPALPRARPAAIRRPGPGRLAARLGRCSAEAGEWRRAHEVLAEAVDGAQLAGDRLLSARGTIALLYLDEVTRPRGWTEQAEREAAGRLRCSSSPATGLASPTAGGSSPMSTTAGFNGRNWSGSGSASSATPAGRGIDGPRRAFWEGSRRACVLGRRRPGRRSSAASGLSQSSAGRPGRP